MHSQYLHLRVIDGALERSPSSQYDGDLWGLYLGLEPTEGNFLDERDLPDGNVYSIEGNAGDKKHQGAPPAVADSSDWESFRISLETSGQSEQWYRDNVDLPSLYTFLALMASDATPGGGQIGQLLDEYASMFAPAGTTLHWANLDAALWNLHPRTAGDGSNTGQTNHKGNVFRSHYLDGARSGLGGTTQTSSWIRSLNDPDADGFSDHAGIVKWLTNYTTNTWPGGTWSRKAMPGVGSGTDTDPNRQLGYGYKSLEFEALYGGWIDCNANPASSAADLAIPNKPTVNYVGNGFATDDLVFKSSAFSDPQGASTYQSHQWRVAEIQGPGIAGWAQGAPRRYEIETTWQSADLTTAPGLFRFPAGLLQAGKTYRTRVRHRDTTGRWSAWSDPIQFTAAAAQSLALIHYWNFNDATSYLIPSQAIGAATLTPILSGTSEVLSDTGKDFAALNARNGDLAGAHLRVNNPLGATLDWALPTTGFENVVITYETRRSGSGAGRQVISYTLDGGQSYALFDTRTILDADPVVETLDFRQIVSASHNPDFGIRISFQQADGGTVGNNRFDNLVVAGKPTGYADWRNTHFTSPSDVSNPAISGPAANPTGDGIANLIRYSLGVGPYEPISGLLPVVKKQGETLAFRFRADPAKSDLAYRVLASSDLRSWANVIFDSRTAPLPPAEDGWHSVAVPIQPDTRFFLRLEVTQGESPGLNAQKIFRIRAISRLTPRMALPSLRPPSRTPCAEAILPSTST